MAKRLTALLFILFLGGQVWAGICPCMSQPAGGMKCCKKNDQAKRDSMSRKKCCDGVCGTPLNERQSRSQSEPAFKLPAVIETIESRSDFRPVFAADRPVAVLRFDSVSPSRYSRPPNLYIQHHSILI